MRGSAEVRWEGKGRMKMIGVWKGERDVRGVR